jgi:hypothetical protein
MWRSMRNIGRLPVHSKPTTGSGKFEWRIFLEKFLTDCGHCWRYFWLGRDTGTGSAFSALESSLAAHSDK